MQCHRFWEFESVPPKASFAAASASSAQQNQAPDSITGLVNNALTRLYRESEPRWSCPEQQLSVEAILSGESPLVCILPTGGGKSGLILLPAIIDSTKTSVVFTPYIALAQDLTRHCETLGIDCINWQPDTRLHRPTIVVVVIDTGVSDEFLTYIRDIDLDGQLARVYVDECQTLVTERAFRPKLTQLKRVSLPVAWIFLTATYPPSLATEFEDQQLLTRPRPRYIRASTNRTNTEYHVRIIQGSGIDVVLEAVCRYVEQVAEEFGPGEKILIFTKAIDTLTQIAARLKCFIYHSTLDGKEDFLSRWIRGERIIMASTSGLGAGVNITGVKLVVHVEETWGATSFVQESGRGGRQGEKFQSVTFISKGKLDYLRSKTDLPLEQRVLVDFIDCDDCRRAVLSGYFDVEATNCRQSGSVLWFCREQLLRALNKSEKKLLALYSFCITCLPTISITKELESFKYIEPTACIAFLTLHAELHILIWFCISV
jgi:superfamily II DNA helicase RecQ